MPTKIRIQLTSQLYHRRGFFFCSFGKDGSQFLTSFAIFFSPFHWPTCDWLSSAIFLKNDYFFRCFFHVILGQAHTAHTNGPISDLTDCDLFESKFANKRNVWIMKNKTNEKIRTHQRLSQMAFFFVYFISIRPSEAASTQCGALWPHCVGDVVAIECFVTLKW